MTPQEQTLIDELVERIRNTPLADKDIDAERHLQQTLGQVPDALYVLTQTVLVQQYGLTQAQAQLAAKQDEIDELKRSQSASQAVPKSSGSFLSRIFGSDENTAPTQPITGSSTSGYQPVNYASPAQGGGYPPPPAGAQTYGGQVYGSSYGGPGYPAQGYAPGSGGPGSGGPGSGGPGYGGPGYGSPAGGSSMGMGGGGFLRGALQTAAGVAAGEMVFRGMEDLFRGFGGGGHGLVGGEGESVVNNYYEGGGTEHRGGDTVSGDDSGFYNPANDASRSDGENAAGRGFGDLGGSDDSQQAGSDTFADDSTDSDDNSFGDDDSSGDSGDSGFDNSGDDNY